MKSEGLTGRFCDCDSDKHLTPSAPSAKDYAYWITSAGAPRAMTQTVSITLPAKPGGMVYTLKDSGPELHPWDDLLSLFGVEVNSPISANECTCGGTKCGTPHSSWCDSGLGIR